MHILVTGGTGHIGHVTTAWLLDHGHDVRVLDRHPPGELVDVETARARMRAWQRARAEAAAEAAAETEETEEGEAAHRGGPPPRSPILVAGADYRQADITDFASLAPHVEGVEGVVHLAAIPHPMLDPGHVIFHVNCGGTFNVYRAAADAGVRRVVTASSINWLGNNFGKRNIEVRYLPIDEAHPGYATDPYAFSKQVVEEIAAYFWRREGVSGVCLRFPFVLDAGQIPPEQIQGFRDRFRAAYDTLMALPEAERQARVQQLLRRYQEARDLLPSAMRAALEELPEAVLLFGRNDFWSIVSTRDAAQAIEKGLLAEYEGSHPLYIADSHNLTGLPSRDLAALFYPDVTTWKRPVEGTETLLSIDRARELIGYEPEHGIGG
jgi:nucleoside-diphosphate-sugar epimerase